MKDINEHKKIAVLIDADNAQMSKLKLIIEEISAHGHIVVKRAYGDWSSSQLKNWRQSLNELVIQPIQQFAYITGKNSTDTAMVIDTMDLLYTEKFDAFALISSDSDFTKLASRLRESEKYVFGVGVGVGVGEKKTPISFRNACDDFIYTENLNEILLESADKPKKRVDNSQDKSGENEIILLLDKAWKKHQDEDGWANVSSAGSFIKRTKPDFYPKNYNVNKLPEIIERLSEHFKMKKYKGKGSVHIIAYQSKRNLTKQSR
ncbi:NYN domain-containing protein [Photobacterium sp.]|uniref:NYN domain-containing protein n=1 Tax=Photobacterium sp. TaxID=660 RepID=UPI00299DA34E|nr:NYN domain-containing protein [Photobacterium sp.]MDX1302776.1 NYN domain-containing protein [Photobacterium sp.]